MKTAALARMLRRPGEPPPVTDRCALCAVALPDDHPHLLDVEEHRPVCACRACALLFDRAGAHDAGPTRAGAHDAGANRAGAHDAGAKRAGAAPARFRPIPGRRRRVTGLSPAVLRVPVGLAFFTVSEHGEVTARYPSPAGATQWEVDPADWTVALADCPALEGLEPEVEALLVNTVRGRSDAFIVPVSDCYRLVAAVRCHWRGLTGGDRVWPAIETFLDELREAPWDASGSADRTSGRTPQHT